jgi:hypothetical protein
MYVDDCVFKAVSPGGAVFRREVGSSFGENGILFGDFQGKKV